MQIYVLILNEGLCKYLKNDFKVKKKIEIEQK